MSAKPSNRQAGALLICLTLFGLAAPTSAGATEPVISNRYLIQGDRIFDKKTRLVWQRCSIGQRWEDGAGCTGRVTSMNFDDAKSHEKDGWRLPTLDELRSLPDAAFVGKQRIPINDVAFPDMDPARLGYWTSTTETRTVGSFAWVVHFVPTMARSLTQTSVPESVRLVKTSDVAPPR